MSVKLRQHWPSWYETSETPATAEVETAEEALALPWIAVRAKAPRFKRYVESEGRYLMFEETNGDYWVIAYMSGSLGLPEWKKPAS